LLIVKGLADSFVGGDEFTLAMGDGEVDGAQAFGPDTFAFAGKQMNPAIDKSTGVIVGQSGGLAGLAGEGAREEVGLNQNLESIADSDDWFAGFDEAANGLAEVMDDLIGEDFPGGDVVAVAEAAGESEDLAVGEDSGGFENAVYMH
jgi:hypothetical protein